MHRGTHYVLKRDGTEQSIRFDKVLKRIEQVANMSPKLEVDSVVVAQKVIQGIFPGVKTSDLDKLAAEISAYMTTIHPDYEALAARIKVSNLHKETSDSFLETMTKEYEYVSPKTKESNPLLADDVYEIIKKNAETLQKAIDYSRDYNFTYFGFKTLEKSYLVKLDQKIVERPQHMYMRVAVGIHKHDISSALETYDALSRFRISHATPTLFNAGTPKPQMSSCFLLDMKVSAILCVKK